ncbi:MAG: DUF928 domain-containing protein [Cyanobacteria bacterium P01_F01_bin.150]
MKYVQRWELQRSLFSSPWATYQSYGAQLLVSPLLALGILAPISAQSSVAQLTEPAFADETLNNISPSVEAIEAETASPSQGTSIQTSPIIFNAPPPPGRGAPRGRRVGGASRGNCLNYEGLTALVPVTDNPTASASSPNQLTWGQTTATNPTLWFYSPEGLIPEVPIELVVQDGTDQYIAATTLEVEAAAGIIAVQVLPNLETNAGTTAVSTVTLPVDDLLPWTFSIYCDPERSTAFVSVKGAIQRVTMNGVMPFSGEVDVNDRKRSLSQARTYAAAGIWHDALTIVATLHHAHPTDAEIDAAWTDLLQQIGLESLAAEPIQDCCIAEQ